MSLNIVLEPPGTHLSVTVLPGYLVCVVYADVYVHHHCLTKTKRQDSAVILLEILPRVSDLKRQRQKLSSSRGNVNIKFGMK